MNSENEVQLEPAEPTIVAQRDLDRFFAQGNPLKLMDQILEMVAELKTQPLTEAEKTQLAKKLIGAVNPVFSKELVV